MQQPTIIKNAIVDCGAGRKKIVDGIINSAYLTTFQRQSMDGIIKSSMTSADTKEAKSKKSCKPKTTKVSPMATLQQIGMVHIGGSPFPKRR